MLLITNLLDVWLYKLIIHSSPLDQLRVCLNMLSYTGRPVRVKIPARAVGRRVIILMSEGRVNMGYEPSRVERKKFRGPGRFLQARLSKSDTWHNI